MDIPSLGALPSKPDYRDHKTSVLATSVPLEYEIDKSKLEITNQKTLGICSSNLAYYIEYLYWKKTGIYTKLSRRFLYTLTKNIIDGDTFEGAQMRSVLKAAQKYGVCTEQTYPSDTQGLTHAEYIDMSKIPAKAFVEALDYKIGSYVSINTTVFDLTAALYKYGMLYNRFEVGPTWWTAKDGHGSWAPRDIAPLRKPEGATSGHAVCMYGYDFMEIAEYKIMNSWSTSWCDQGTCTTSVDNLPTEAWAITLEFAKNDLPAAKDFKYTFTKTMTRGSTGNEVLNLQIALMISGDLDFVQPADRGYYGAKTAKAVYDFQRRTGIGGLSNGLYCGPKTLAALNAIYSK